MLAQWSSQDGVSPSTKRDVSQERQCRCLDCAPMGKGTGEADAEMLNPSGEPCDDEDEDSEK